MKTKHSTMYMEIAEVAARQSYANRLKVGAVIVRDHRILAASYNGTPPGTSNACEYAVEDAVGYKTGTTRPEVIHAEMNAIFRLARDGESGKGADLFITHSPCFECAKAILSVGIKKVWFREHYRELSGVEFLERHGVEVEHYDKL